MKKLLLNLVYFFVIVNAIAQNNCINNKIMHDYEGNVYETVQIGKQCWMKENMRTLHNAKGDPISLVPRDSMSLKNFTPIIPAMMKTMWRFMVCYIIGRPHKQYVPKVGTFPVNPITLH